MFRSRASTSTVYLKVHNPNDFDVQILGAVHADVTIANRIPLPPVDMSPATWVASNDAVILPVETKVPWTAVPAVIGDSFGDKVTFHFHGDADVTASRAFGIREDDYPIEQDGVLPRSLFMKASPSGLNVWLGGDSARNMLPFDSRGKPCGLPWSACVR